MAVLWLIMTVLVSACGSNQSTKNIPQDDYANSDPVQEEQAPFSVEETTSPGDQTVIAVDAPPIELDALTIAYRVLEPDNRLLRLVLVEGQISEQWQCDVVQPAFFAHAFEGRYKLVYETCSGDEIDSIHLSFGDFGDQLLFKHLFQIEVADYNKDGHIDFTIGQFLTASKWWYKVYSIKDDKIIDLTPSMNGIAVQRESIAHSILFETKGTSIVSALYDAEKNHYVLRSYLWDETLYQYNDWMDTVME